MARRRPDEGYTIIELLSVCLITLFLLALGATAARHYWIRRSLHGAQDSIAAELRELGERSRSEGHPLVYGLRVRPGSGPGGASQIGVVRFDYAAGTCTQVATTSLDAGVYVSAADFTVLSPGPTAACRSSIPGASSDQFAFMFARGTATAGSVTIRHASISEPKIVSVSQLTGKVTKP